MFDHALLINPNNWETYYNKGRRYKFIFLGIALSNIQEYEEANIMFDYALKINPNNNETYNIKGKRLYFLRACLIQFRKI